MIRRPSGIVMTSPGMMRAAGPLPVPVPVALGGNFQAAEIAEATTGNLDITISQPTGILQPGDIWIVTMCTLEGKGDAAFVPPTAFTELVRAENTTNPSGADTRTWVGAVRWQSSLTTSQRRARVRNTFVDGTGYGSRVIVGQMIVRGAKPDGPVESAFTQTMAEYGNPRGALTLMKSHPNSLAIHQYISVSIYQSSFPGSLWGTRYDGSVSGLTFTPGFAADWREFPSGVNTLTGPTRNWGTGYRCAVALEVIP